MNFPNIQNHLMTYSASADQTVYPNAEGAHFMDEAGRVYINMNDISCVLGYRHPRFTAALAELVQTKLLGHFGTLSADKEQLIRNFMEATHGDFDKICIASSGGETVDWALKAARRHTGRDGIISFRSALHGRSFAGAYISDTPLRKEGFGTGLQNVHFWDYPADGRAFEPAADEYTDIAAVILEPYQAMGMASPSKEYWRWLRDYTREKGIVLILDEIQTGFGKTGSFFAYEETGIVPDILLAGKGMSNGFGLGAILLSKEVAASMKPNELSGGSADNDLMCSVVNTIFDIYRDEGILEHVRKMGSILETEIPAMLNELGIEGRLYGRGLFFGLELPQQMRMPVFLAAKERGVAFGASNGKILLRPPLVITEEEIRTVCAVLRECLTV